MCPYASFIDCCIFHFSGTCAGPCLVVGGGGGGCNCMLLAQHSKFHRCWSWSIATCAGGVFPLTGANTPLVHVVMITLCYFCWWCFSFWHKFSTYTLAKLHCVLVVVCGGACMWWWYVVVVVYDCGDCNCVAMMLFVPSSKNCTSWPDVNCTGMILYHQPVWILCLHICTG